MKLISFLFCLALLSAGCSLDLNTRKKVKLAGTWRLADVNPINDNSEVVDAFEQEAMYRSQISSGLLINLFEDGSYSELNGDGFYKTGSWSYNAEQGTLQFKDSGKKSEPILIQPQGNSEGGQFMLMPMLTKNVILKFAKEAVPMQDFLQDPFHFTNNQWRIKPSKPETIAELNKRIANYIRHLALILKSAQDRKQDVVSFEYSMGPVKIYNAAIGIHPYENVPEYWKNCFYDHTDAAKAYYLYEQYLNVDSYKGGSTGDWIQDDYNILMSMYTGFTKAVATTK